jgi:rod shape-determining protein MreC
MGSVLQFIKTYLHLILFVVLQILSFILIVNFHVYHKTLFFNTSNAFFASITEYSNAYKSYFQLKSSNSQLVKENLVLRKLLKENYYIQPNDTFFVSDTLFKQRYKYIAAQVVGNTTDNPNNYLTINRGKESGIQIGMGVFSPLGIVGIVEDVSDNFALVMSVLHSKAVVSPKIQELNLSQGKIKWEERNPDYVFLSGINRYEKVAKGQKVVTSPYSTNFPENLPIGTVVDVKEVDGSFLRAKVKLSANFSQLREVYVVKDLFKQELDYFENKIKEDNQ